jgi:DNA-binding FadR family transcriptional regulator
MTTTPIRVPKMSTLVLAELRTEIATGQLAAGANMPTEGELVERFGVSRNTVREAMRVLETDGFVTTRRGLRNGAVVTTPTGAAAARQTAMMLRQQGATVGDVYTARLAVEPFAARLLAEGDAAVAAAALTELLAVERAAVGNPAAWGDAAGRFHQAVTGLCDNLTLRLIGSQLHEITESQISIEMAQGNDALERRHFKKVDNTHARLIALIAAGEAEAAEALWRDHLQAARPWHIHTETVSIDEILR